MMMLNGNMRCIGSAVDVDLGSSLFVVEPLNSGRSKFVIWTIYYRTAFDPTEVDVRQNEKPQRLGVTACVIWGRDLGTYPTSLYDLYFSDQGLEELPT